MQKKGGIFMANEKQKGAFLDFLVLTIRLSKKQDVFELLKIKEHIFDHEEKGTNHYTETYDFRHIVTIKMCEMDDVSKEKYGVDREEKSYEINLKFSGRGIQDFGVLSDFDNFYEMLKHLYKNEKLLTEINFTRADFTRDEKAGLLDLDDIIRKIEKDEVIKKSNSHNVVLSQFDKETCEYLGKTLYLGSKSSNSEFFIRIYNKTAEAINRGKLTLGDIDNHHLRFEMVYKSKRQANPFMKIFMEFLYERPDKITELWNGIMREKLKLLKNRITSKTYDIHKVDKQIYPAWKKFLDTSESIRIGVERNESTSIEEKKLYFESHSKTLSMLYESMGNSAFNFMIEEMIEKGRGKFDVLDREDIKEYRKKHTITWGESALKDKTS